MNKDLYITKKEINYIKLYVCCNKFRCAYNDDAISITDDFNFFICGNDGEGICYDIMYCPFCGKKLKNILI